MRTFAQKPKAPQQTTSAKPNPPIPGRALYGQSSEAPSALHLPRTIGNQAVQQLVQATNEEFAVRASSTTVARFAHDFSQIPVHAKAHARVQPKLTISIPGDIYEQEADRIADQVMRVPDAAVAVMTSAPTAGTVQRVCADCDEEVQRKTDGGPGVTGRPATLATEPAVRALARGIPLPASERAFFEPRFGWDFSNVRLHADSAAGRATQSIDARAFTLGGDIAFAPGEYAPGTAKGRRLLAHELTHVMQQADTPAALRVMRTPYPGCDRRTTGLDDADARIDRARAEALRIMATARAAFPRMSPRTIRLADRHFHCPSSSQILAMMPTFAAIETIIPSLDVHCVSGSTKKCGGLGTAWIFSDGKLELCPHAFAEEFKEKLGGIAGNFIWGATVNAGLDETCGWLTPCYDDFTVPASDRIRHTSPYQHLALDLAGYPQQQPPTIPCAPRSTYTYVSVPPGAVNDPKLIRPVTGYETPPPGSVILTVHEDRAGHKFIYHDDLPDAQVYMPNEPKRYYLSPSVWAVKIPTAEELRPSPR